MSLPERVARAEERAARAGFENLCGRPVGRLLASLAAAVPLGGRVLEIGTGLGVGLAWIVSGLEERDDVEVISVECDLLRSENTARDSWPPWVRLVAGSAENLLPDLGRFSLAVADAEMGKWVRLDLSIEALHRRGVLVVNDMSPNLHDAPSSRSTVSQVRTALLGDSRLMAAEITASSGIITATRK